jgi:hypothetical protein
MRLLVLVAVVLVLGCVCTKGFDKGSEPDTSPVDEVTTQPSTTVEADVVKNEAGSIEQPSEATGRRTTSLGSVLVNVTPGSGKYSMRETFRETAQVGGLDRTRTYLVVVRTFSPGATADGGLEVKEVDNAYTSTVGLKPFTHKDDIYKTEMRFSEKGIRHYAISVYDCTQIRIDSRLENCGRGKRLPGDPGWEKPDGWMGQQPAGEKEYVVDVV